MGYTDKAIEEQFRHMLEALSYGAPPHGGIAHGVERLLMTLLGEEYLREVQAFPQTSSGRTSVMDAPSELSKEQLKELHIKIDSRK
jgi:aspartyl-tRNA synthetase